MRVLMRKEKRGGGGKGGGHGRPCGCVWCTGSKKITPAAGKRACGGLRGFATPGDAGIPAGYAGPKPGLSPD